MNSEKFCLRWNDFQANISEAFNEIRDEKDFFDVTLACGNEQVQAHKLILSACSPFFKNILRSNPHQHPLLYLKGVQFTDLQAVLNFMYHGEVNVAQEELNSFLAVAEDLMVKGLTQNSNSKYQDQTKKINFPPSKSLQAVHKQSVKEKPFQPKPALPKLLTYSSHDTADDDDVQEVAPTVKTEPRDLTNPIQMQKPELQDHYNPNNETHYSLTPSENRIAYNEDNYEEYDDHYGEEQEYHGGDEVHMPTSRGDLHTGQSLQDPSELLQFVRKDSTDQKYHCTLCRNFSHKVISCTRNHVESKHYPNVFTYSCDQCEETFSTKTNLNTHRTRKHKQMKNPQFYRNEASYQ